jgi:DNA-binding LytR/AlgR family response regulator
MNMMALRTLIADDEPLMLERLRDMVQSFPDQLELIAEAENGEDALELFEAHVPDVVFLDIRMPGLTGLEVAAAIGERAHVVFVTAYDQFAVQAFDRGAVDYLLKPLEQDRMELTLRRIRERASTGAAPPDVFPALHAMRQGRSAAQEVERLKWIKALVGNDIRMFPVNDVVFFQSDMKYTRVVTETQEVLIRTPLKELLDGLEPEQFWQVHRSTIVNTQRIDSILREGAEKHYLVLRGTKEKIPISRQFYPLFKQM